MKVYRLAALVAATISVVACAAAPLSVNARFERIGLAGNQPAAISPKVESPNAIAVHLGSSPPGFSLRENELTVEQGYGHEILGTVSLRYAAGTCFDPSSFGPSPRKHFLQLLTHKAHEKGANAIIYVTSELAEDATTQDLRNLCIERAHSGSQFSRSYASGWAVVLASP